VPSGGADPGNDQSVNTGGGIGSFDTSGNIGAGSTASTLASQQASAADVRSAASSAASTGAASGDIIGNATSTGHPSVMAVPGLDWASGLQHTGQQWPLYVRALGLFTQHHGQDSDALTEAALQGNTPRLRQLAHALAGASAAVGARLVQQQAKALEAICRTPGHGGEELHQVLPLVEALEHLIESLRAALHSPAAPAKRPPDGQPAPEQHQALHPILRRLLPLLASHDTSACEIFEAHRNEFLAGLGAEGPALAEAIDSFQFEAAHSLVTKLLDLA
jgi:HPt (histidine-containing phosphotransfer) domain-containing protein